MTTQSELSLSEQAAPRAVIGDYLATRLAEPAWRDARIELIAGGKSNLTFLVSASVGSVVLRRPPLSNRLSSAHDMGREHRVMSALSATDVPVPSMLVMCTDESIIRAPFYVMERVSGHIVRDELPAGYAESPSDRRAIGEGLIDVLVELHAVDPAAVGLGDYGHPEGYLSRQIRRWSEQWRLTRQPAETAGDELDRLMTRLTDSLPSAPTGPIVHGDFRLDNVLLEPEHPGKIAAVLDWELSTLGDPVADLGLLCVYWQQADDSDLRLAAGLSRSVTRRPGFPSRRDLLERYASRSGRDLSDLDWYVAFACFKLAVVLTGVAARGRAGAMIGDGFVEMAARIPPLIAIGHGAMSGRAPSR
jgi:aminoglycoside phosphotransferase (APT) family kinase protein